MDWSIVFLILASAGVFISRNIIKTDAEEIENFGIVMIVLFAVFVTLPMAFFSFGYVAYFILHNILGLSVTIWESALIILLTRLLLSKGE